MRLSTVPTLFLVAGLIACGPEDEPSPDPERDGGVVDVVDMHEDSSTLDMSEDIGPESQDASLDLDDLVDLGMMEDMSCPAPSCEGVCGTQTSACGATAECEPCIDEARFEELAAWADDYISTLIAKSYPQALVPDFTLAQISMEAREILRDYAASDAGFIAALRHITWRSRVGHTFIYDAQDFTCADINGAGDSSISRLGACAVAHNDGFIVTFVGDENPLGLSKGDMIVAAEGNTSEDLISYSLARPVCEGGAASEQALAENAARSFFSALPEGITLRVRDPQGTLRDVITPAPLDDPAQWLSCFEPLGRAQNFVAQSRVRPDGVAVIRLTRFTPLNGFDLQQDIQLQIDALKQELKAEFDKVKTADAIIWDVRSNPGGASPVGFSIVEGMPGAKAVGIARCSTRVAHTDPPRYNYFGPNYNLEPQTLFGFDGPVALLIDGRTFSAGDYFALAASLGSDALIVGTQTAGAYGGSGPSEDLPGTFGLTLGLDPFRCNDLDGNPLEMRGTLPDVWVDYDPIDLSQGVDTLEEEAAALLLNTLP